MIDGYDPTKSRVAEDKLSDFLRAPISGDITEVPGIGKVAAEKLNSGPEEDRVENTFQLIGKFLILKQNAKNNDCIDCKDHCDAFWYWLKSKEINHYRSAIVQAIAEKTNTMLPGIYNASDF